MPRSRRNRAAVVGTINPKIDSMMMAFMTKWVSPAPLIADAKMIFMASKTL